MNGISDPRVDLQCWCTIAGWTALRKCTRAKAWLYNPSNARPCTMRRGGAGHAIIPLMPGFSGRPWGAFYNTTCRDRANLPACTLHTLNWRSNICSTPISVTHGPVKSVFFLCEAGKENLQRICAIAMVADQIDDVVNVSPLLVIQVCWCWIFTLASLAALYTYLPLVTKWSLGQGAISGTSTHF